MTRRPKQTDGMRTDRTVREVVAGIARPPRAVPYEVRMPSGDWSGMFGAYEKQKWGPYDTDSCWKLAQVNCLEDDLNWLHRNGMFSAEAEAFFAANKYIDGDGDFSISERYGEIKGGLKQAGGSGRYAWQIDQKWGCLPRASLSYSDAAAAAGGSNDAFAADYFSPKAVTPQMDAVAAQFKRYVSMDYKPIGRWGTTPPMDVLAAALQQAPIQIGVPVPYQQGICLWNAPLVKYHGEMTADHEVELYAVRPGTAFPYLVFDQYEPHLKQLSADYYIVVATQGVVSAIPEGAPPVPQRGWWNSFWQGVEALYDWRT